MASGKTDIAENRTLDAWFGAVALAPPATWYVALFTASPGEVGGGTEVSVTGTGYARIAVTNNATNFPAASGGLKSNGTAITSAVSTASWGTIVAIGLFDASTAGNMLFYADIALADQQNINAANQQWSLPIGALDITEN